MFNNHLPLIERKLNHRSSSDFERYLRVIKIYHLIDFYLSFFYFTIEIEKGNKWMWSTSPCQAEQSNVTSQLWISVRVISFIGKNSSKFSIMARFKGCINYFGKKMRQESCLKIFETILISDVSTSFWSNFPI